jgi:hypothetical protein
VKAGDAFFYNGLALLICLKAYGYWFSLIMLFSKNIYCEYSGRFRHANPIDSATLF